MYVIPGGLPPAYVGRLAGGSTHPAPCKVLLVRMVRDEALTGFFRRSGMPSMGVLGTAAPSRAQQRETTRRIGAIMLLVDGNDSEQKVRFGVVLQGMRQFGQACRPGRMRAACRRAGSKIV